MTNPSSREDAIRQRSAPRSHRTSPNALARSAPHHATAGALQDAIRRFDLEIAVVTVLVVAVALPVWPGVHTVDSQAMLNSALENRISNWYAPLHAWAWGLSTELGLPDGTVLVVAAASLVVALLAVYRLWISRWAALIATSLTVLFPPVYGLLGWVGRDVWFTAELVGVVALVGWSAQRPARRRVLLSAAAVLACAAADARQNGFVLLAFVAGWGAWLACRRTGRPALVGTTLVACLGGAVVGVFGVGLAQEAVVTEHYSPEQPLYYYDLMGMSIVTGSVLIPPSLFPEQDLAIIESQWRVAYASPDGAVANDGAGSFVLRPYADGAEVTRTLRSAWADAIVAHPTAYANVRARLHMAQLGLSERTRGAYYGWTDELDWDRGAALRQDFPALNDARLRWLDATGGEAGDGGWLHTPWLYLVGGLCGAAVGRRRGGMLGALGWSLVLLVVAMQAVLIVVSPVSNFRYQLPTVVIGIVLTVVAVLRFRPDRAGSEGQDGVSRPQGPVSGPAGW